jgi:hypothetical protein
MLLLITGISGPVSYHPTTFVFPPYRHSYGIRKAGPTELFLFMSFKVKFSDPQGLACVRLEAWEDSTDPHDDDELTVYGVNSGQNNIIYNKSMWDLDVYGLHEKDEQRLSQPHGICANSRGDVYVADSGNNRIVRLFNPAHKLEYITAIGGVGDEPGRFLYPLQVALDSHGMLYISDTGNHRIQVFDRENRFQYTFNNFGKMVNPNGLAVTDRNEPYTHQGQNFLVVIDSADQRITKFDLQGKWLRTIRCRDFGFVRAKLEYVSLDYYNQIIITDSWNHCLHKLDHDLNHIVSFGREGQDDFEFNEPRGITQYRRFGQVFVAEKSGAQYYWVGTDLLQLTVENQKEMTYVQFNVTEPSYVSADVLDNEGRFIQRIADHLLVFPLAQQRLKWNGRMGRGIPRFLQKMNYTPSPLVGYGDKLPAGIFRLRIVAESTYSSRSYFERTEEKMFTR